MTTNFNTHRHLTRLTQWGILGCALSVAACSSLDSASSSVVSSLAPYRPEVVQGNFVSKEQVALLKAGLTKLQVRQLLGTPLVTSVFHGNRWDYVFTINRQGTDPQQRRLTIFFQGDLVEKFVGDPMPSEQEFITSITREKAFDKPKRLLATAEELSGFQQANPPNASSLPNPSLPAPATIYPPLESGVGR